MNRFIPIIHEIIAVLQTNKMKITFRELREKLSDMAKNVPKVAKSHQAESQKIVLEGDRKHMYIVGARRQIQLSHEMLLKIYDKMSPK